MAEKIKQDQENGQEVKFLSFEEQLNGKEDNELQAVHILLRHERCASHTFNLIATTDANKEVYPASQKQLMNAAWVKATGV